MSMASILSEMPDLWRRILGEHVAGPDGYCRSCRDSRDAARWPCAMYDLGAEAQFIHRGGLPGTSGRHHRSVGGLTRSRFSQSQT